FPEPDRRDIEYRRQDLPTASVLASRGCPWKCSFCSIITFYEANGTTGRRRRNPIKVVDEVECLVRERGVKLILFQDDDFLAGGTEAKAWAKAVAGEIVHRKLEEEMRWKIACRSDEIRADLLAPLVAAGLCHVYMGVEGGDDASLAALNKHLKPAVHLHAGKILRELNVSFDFGFMLLEPWSTLQTARNNMEFLRLFTEDGWAVAGFCRTLPYVGTPIERRLREEGRLNGSSLEAEYRFLDTRVDLLWDFCLMAFEGRNFGTHATWNVLRGLLFDTHLDMPGRPRNPDRDAAARMLVQASNGVMLDVLENAIDLIDSGEARALAHRELVNLARFARTEDQSIRRQLMAMERANQSTYELLFR
ncbi:MAG TPA: radical SAM protein, partial [Nitrospira sp.]|nr:radical SAM protein [Nitrospira sp.]